MGMMEESQRKNAEALLEIMTRITGYNGIRTLAELKKLLGLDKSAKAE